MTCVLSIPAVYMKPFGEVDVVECESFDFNWVKAQYPHSGLSDEQRSHAPCHMTPGSSSSVCRMAVSNGPVVGVKQELLNGLSEKVPEETSSEERVPTNGKQVESKLFDMCNETDAELDQMNIKNNGVKRKAENSESEDIYIPAKRVSPFLNTPKERKDVRKKILKISIKKLKHLEDPEAFLRRTVLVSNTTKRLQTELRQEKLRRKKRKSFSKYDILNNNCMSDVYLFEDPFLSGVHEKITDDMTDTLISNVFSDESNEPDISDKTNEVVNKIEVSNEKPFIDSRSFTSLNISNESSNEEGDTVIQTTNECSSLTCVDRTALQEMPVDRFDDLKIEINCSENSSEKNY